MYRVSVSPASKEQLCILCTTKVINKDYKRKLISSGIKTRVCLDLELLSGREFGDADLTTNIICRNCADKNSGIVKKILGVRRSVDSAKETIAAQKGGTTSVKRLHHREYNPRQREPTQTEDFYPHP